MSVQTPTADYTAKFNRVKAMVDETPENKKKRMKFCTDHPTDYDCLTPTQRTEECNKKAKSAKPSDCGSSTEEIENATSACVKIKEVQADIENSKTWSDNLTTIATGGMSALIDLFKADGDALQEINTIMRTEISVNQIQDLSTVCTNSIDQTQSNEINGMTPECLTFYLDSLKGRSEESYQAFLTNNTWEINKFEQFNDGQAVSDCVSELAISLFSTSDNSIENTALQKAVAEATNPGAKAKAENKGCSDITTNMTTCQYIKSQQCCANVINQRQTNAVNPECSLNVNLNDSKQANIANSYASCSMSSESSMSSDIISKMTNRTTQSAESKATGLDIAGMFKAAAMAYMMTILGGIFGGTMLGYGLIKSKGVIIVVAGIIVLAIGGANLGVYSSQVKNKNDIIYEDSCRSICDDVVSEPVIRYSTYSDAVAYAKQIKAVGFDFFVDGEIVQSKDFKIKGDTKGRAIFMTEIPDDIDYESDCDNFDQVRKAKAGMQNVSVRTTIFGEEPQKVLLGVGITCIILGLFCMGMGIYMMSKKKVQPGAEAGVEAGVGVGYNAGRSY